MPVREAEQRLGGGVVHVDLLLVLHVELDHAERVLVAGLLDVFSVLDDEIVRRQPALALLRQLFLDD